MEATFSPLREVIKEKEIDLQQFRETTDGGISWSAPKLTKTFDPPSVGTRTQYEDDRTVYVAEDPGITRVGVMFSKEYLEAEMDKLDISQYVAVSSVWNPKL